MSNLNIETIRQRYPNPVPGTQSVKIEEYCIGGALCCTLWGRHFEYRFPEPQQIARALIRANPRITNKWAERYAMRIINLNDKELFEEAWTLLGHALEVDNCAWGRQ